MPPTGLYNLLITFLYIQTRDIESPIFVHVVEKKLIDAYAELKYNRLAETWQNAEIVNVSRRKSVNTTVDVHFIITENGLEVSATQVRTIFNHASIDQLQEKLGHNVSDPVNPVSVVPAAKFQLKDVLGMVLKDNQAFDRTQVNNRIIYVFERNSGVNGGITIKDKKLIREAGGNLYIEFYMLQNDAVLNASFVGNVFSQLPLSEFNTGDIQATVLPFGANLLLSYSPELLVKMSITPEGNPDPNSVSFKYTLAGKIGELYLRGKQSGSRRRRRAVGSTQVQIKRITPLNNGEMEVVFMVNDGGKAVSGSEVTVLMKRVSSDTVKQILDVKSFTSPEPIIQTTVQPQADVEYWIIGAVVGPVVFIVLICVLFVWRWKAGGPNKKINPMVVETVEMVKKPEALSPGTDGMNKMRNGDVSIQSPLEVSANESSMDAHNLNDLKMSQRKKVPSKTNQNGISSVRNTPESRIPSSLEGSMNEESSVVDERNSTQRRKVPMKRNQTYGLQNPLYGFDDEDEDIEDGVESEEERVVIRKPPKYSPVDEGLIEKKRIIELLESKPQFHEDLYKKPPLPPLEIPSKPPPPPSSIRSSSPMRPPSLSPRVLPSTKGRKPFQLTADVMESEDEVKQASLNYSAADLPTFGQMKEEATTVSTPPPVRFRSKIDDSPDAYMKPAGPLPALDLSNTSLMGAPSIVPGSQEDSPPQVDPELKHKADLERLRNKQRQRDQLFSIGASLTTPSTGLDKKYWKKEQDKIDAVLNPDSLSSPSISISARKGRLRRRLRRKNKVYLSAENLDKIERRRVKKESSRESKPFKNLVASITSSEAKKEMMESEAESEISMGETRRRIHTLLDDTFNTLKKYQKQLLKDDGDTPTPSSPTNNIPKNDSSRIHTLSPPRKYAGMQPALPDPPPAHGRASTQPPGGIKQRMIQNPFGTAPFPPYNNNLFNDPMLTWDPLERQRYINQQYGYPGYTPQLPYGGIPNQNVYMTPVQQRPDGMGNMVWSPYNPSNKISETSLKSSTTEHPEDKRFSTMPPLGEYTHAPSPHSTTLDIGGIGKSKSSQPLIRAIKEELLKLSQNANSRTTKIQEISPQINQVQQPPGS